MPPMKRLLLAAVLLSGCASGQFNPGAFRWEIYGSVHVAPGTYAYAENDDTGVIRLHGDDLVADFTGVTITGAPDGTSADRFTGVGLIAENCRNLTVRGLTIRGFKVAMMFRNCDGLTIEDCDVSRNYRQHLQSTPRGEAGADWLFGHENDKDEWLRYGAAIWVKSSTRVTVARCRARNGQNGLCLVNVNDSAVIDNDFSFMSGWGLAMWRSCRNDVSNNSFDWCMRGFSYKKYHRGQDSAGIFVYEQCHDNVFAYNSATHGGDGFFLYAGNETLNRTGTGGCNRNLLYRNDFSHAAANGIEATFSDGNLFVENRLEECDHGVWGGYSTNTVIAGNEIRNCNNGISIEHGHDNRIEGNSFDGCGLAINLWGGPNDQFKKTAFGSKRDTESHGYRIHGNSIRDTKTGLRIRDTIDIELRGNLNEAADPGAQEAPSSTPPPASFTPPRTRGTRDAMLPKNALRGWRYIFVDDWGPYDFTDVRVFPTDIAGWGATELFILGPEGDFTLHDIRGVTASATSGRVPGSITVTPAPGGPFSLTVKTAKESVTAAGFLLAATWEVKVFAWEPQGPQKPPKDWAAVVSGKAVSSFTTAKLDYTDRPNDACPADHYATVATASIELPAGDYEIGTISDDGVRVTIDGKIAIENWTWHPPAENKARVTLSAGKHAVRVEHFEIDGFAQLQLWIRPQTR